MHLIPSFVMVTLLAGSGGTQPTAPAANSPREAPAPRQDAAAEERDVYHITAVRAAPGRYGDLLKVAGTPLPSSSGGFSVVLRHAQGEDWDLLLIRHLGEKAVVERGAPDPTLAERRTITAWHSDSYVLGPPLAEFRKQLGLDAIKTGAGAAPPDVFIISTFNAVPGHQPQLRAALEQPAPGDTSTGSVILTHLEGAPWHLLAISRYASWQDFAKAMSAASGAPAQQTGQKPSGLRQHMSSHSDSLAVPLAVHQGKTGG